MGTFRLGLVPSCSYGAGGNHHSTMAVDHHPFKEGRAPICKGSQNSAPKALSGNLVYSVCFVLDTKWQPTEHEFC